MPNEHDLNPAEAPAGYRAVYDPKGLNCKGCAFDYATLSGQAFDDALRACNGAPCSADQRDDGCAVKFVRAS